MQGLELSRKYFDEYGKKMLETEFSDILHLLAVGLLGSGSECLGFDDDISTDHDFEPGFIIFLPDEDNVDRKIEFKLERAYAKLPNEFIGYKRQRMSPVGGNRHGVVRTKEFFNNLIGTTDGILSIKDYLTLPSYRFLEVTDGEIYFDNLGEVTSIRENLKNFPNDIKKKRLASNLLIMAQAGQYNYLRTLKHNEEGAAQFCVMEFVKATMEVVFLLNDRYMPYYKWSFKAMSSLPKLSDLAVTCEHLITTNNSEEIREDKYYLIEDTCSSVIDVLIDEKLTEANCGDLEKHAYSVNDQIEDNEIRNLNILACV